MFVSARVCMDGCTMCSLTCRHARPVPHPRGPALGVLSRTCTLRHWHWLWHWHSPCAPYYCQCVCLGVRPATSPMLRCAAAVSPLQLLQCFFHHGSRCACKLPTSLRRAIKLVGASCAVLCLLCLLPDSIVFLLPESPIAPRRPSFILLHLHMSYSFCPSPHQPPLYSLGLGGPLAA